LAFNKNAVASAKINFGEHHGVTRPCGEADTRLNRLQAQERIGSADRRGGRALVGDPTEGHG